MGLRTPDLAGSCAYTRVEQLFERCTEHNPTATALQFGSQSRNYRELNERSNQLARYLAARGIGPGSRVAICLERSFEMIEAVLATLKAGAAYVPLDCAYPPGRLNYMLRDSGAQVLITQRGLEDLFNAGADEEANPSLRKVRVDADGPAILRHSSDDPSWERLRHDELYVIYTSGSTGEPKGISLHHQASGNLISWQCRTSAAGAGTPTALFAPLSFDVSFQEIFATLASGGTLVLVSERQRRDPFALLDLLDACSIGRLFLPFVALQQLAECALAAGRFPERLAEIITAGEQLVVTPAIATFFRRLPKCTLWNQYGPSETHVVTSYMLSGPPDQWPRLPPIGKPIDNVEIHIVDGDLKPMATGDAGELCVSGPCLARGYVNRPGLTSERFPLLPAAKGGIRIYRTGDLARLREDGAIEFLGRIDQQVKIDGHRIEPGEVESVIAEHPEVAGVAVVPRELAGGNRLLVSYIVRTGSAEDETRHRLDDAALGARIAEHLRSRLPHYMMPARYCVIPEFPVTPSGKLDRNRLATYDDGRGEVADAPQRLPSGPAEIILSHWSSLVGTPHLGINDNVFEHGASSVMVPQMQRRLLAEFGVLLPAVALFTHPTARGLAEYLGSMSEGVPASRRRSTDGVDPSGNTPDIRSGAMPVPGRLRLSRARSLLRRRTRDSLQ